MNPRGYHSRIGAILPYNPLIKVVNKHEKGNKNKAFKDRLYALLKVNRIRSI